MERKHRTRISNQLLGLLIGVVLLGVSAFLMKVALDTGNNKTFIPAGIFVLLGLILLWSGLRPLTIVITDQAIEHRRGKRVAQRYAYSDMQRVRMISRRVAAQQTRTRRREGQVRLPKPPRQKLFPQILIEGDFKTPYILDMDYKGKLRTIDNVELQTNFSKKSMHNAQAIVADLLSVLPDVVDVEPVVLAYGSGTMPDIDSLPLETLKDSLFGN